MPKLVTPCFFVNDPTPHGVLERPRSLFTYIAINTGHQYDFLRLMRLAFFYLPLSGSVLLSSCNHAPLKLGMEANDTDICDSDEEAVAHGRMMASKAETNRQQMRQTGIKIENLEGEHQNTSRTACYNQEKLAELDNAWHEYYRLNNQGTRKYATHCKRCGETYSMTRDAFQEMLNRAGSNGTTYSMRSYKWFLWAEWDHHTYITSMSIERCLRCCQAWSKDYHANEYRRANSQLDYLRSQLGGEQKMLQNLSKGVEQYQKGAQVLANQSKRKLHHKRQKKIEEQRLQKAEQELQTMEQEQARLDQKIQEISSQQQLQRERAASCLLKLGKPVQTIAQATGLTEAAVMNLKGSNEN